MVAYTIKTADVGFARLYDFRPKFMSTCLGCGLG